MKVSDKEYDRIAKSVANGKIGSGDLPSKQRKTFYILSKVILYDKILDPRHISGHLFSSFKKANDAMYEDYCVEYSDRDGKNTAYKASTAPFETDDAAWCLFNDDDVTIEIQWVIRKVKLDV